jgi:glutaminyl-peptide cyclotransferase
MRSFPLAFCVALSFSSAVNAAVVRPEVVRTLPHDPRAFTQGLVYHDGRFLESTGLRGRSSLRRVVPETGAVEHRVDLSSDRFGEGLALVGSELIQLTWQNRVALRYDLDFARIGTFDYEGEGWGLCYDGERLVMSDGSSKLYFRDPKSFAITGSVEVTRGGAPVRDLNELECVGSLVYANVWQTDTIVRIEPQSGRVLTSIDASGLLSASEATRADVLNGIAFDAATGHFFITGKLWPKLFEVRFAFDPARAEASNVEPKNLAVARPSASVDVAATEEGAAASRDTKFPETTPPSSNCGCRTEGVGASHLTSWSACVLGVVFFACRRRCSLGKTSLSSEPRAREPQRMASSSAQRA